MKAVAILRHAIWQVFGNMGQVLRIVALPTALAFAAMALILPSLAQGLGGPGTMIVVISLTTFLGTWVAVNFHRMVLLGERFDWLPALHLREIGRYLLLMLPMGLLIAVLIMGTGFLLRAVIGDPDLLPSLRQSGPMMILNLVVSMLFTALALRLFAALPAPAIGADTGGVSRALRGTWPVLLGLAASLIVAQFALAFLLGQVVRAVVPGGTPPGPGLLLSLALVQQVIGGLIGLVFISLLTTLYGHYVQGRPLREG